MRSRSHFLIQDPYHTYGREFIQHIHRRYGHRAICFYTDPREQMLHESSIRALPAECIAASYDVDPGRLQDFIKRLRTAHRVLAVIPFNETALLPSVEIAAGLGLSWAQQEIMRRFRDKFALKEYLRRAAPHLRLNASCIVGSAVEVLKLRKQVPYERFVLKPNDGYGNRHIALLGQSSPEAEIVAYFHRLKASAVVMEEYISGVEYFVNGQIDAAGKVATISIFEYERRPANGRHNIDYQTMRVAHGTPLFTRLAQYAEQVMLLSGLRRSPFHLELKVDDQGPCLIEVAARLAGHGNALLSGELHGAPLALIELASHYYLFDADFGPLPLDWKCYNSNAVRYVHGIAQRREWLYKIEGISHVESLPEFYQWVRKPVIGTRIERTIDCLTVPWSVVLRAPTEARVAQASQSVRTLIQLNAGVAPVMRAALMLKFKAPRAVAKIRHLALARWRLLRRLAAAAGIDAAPRPGDLPAPE